MKMVLFFLILYTAMLMPKSLGLPEGGTKGTRADGTVLAVLKSPLPLEDGKKDSKNDSYDYESDVLDNMNIKTDDLAYLRKKYPIDRLSFADKLAGLTLLGKIQGDDVDKLVAIARGDLTPGKLEEALTILKNNLNEQELNKLQELLARNGIVF